MYAQAYKETRDGFDVKAYGEVYKIRELYDGYWVVAHDRGGLAFCDEQFDTIEDAIKFAESAPALCDGEFYSVDEVTLVKRQHEEGVYGWHIFECDC